MKRKEYTEKEVEKALYCTLKDEGKLPPVDIDDIELLEEELGQYPDSTIDLESLTKKVLNSDIEAEKASISSNYVDENVIKGLAAVARNGDNIPDHIRRRMREDRGREEGKNVR